MSKPVTIEDIYELFRASQAEAERRAVEIDRLFAESKAEDERRKAEADRTMEELKRGIAKLEKTVERTSKAVDSLTTRWGRFVEELVEPAVIKLFQAKGIDVKEVHPRLESKRDEFSMEIDIMAVDETELVLVECKSRLSKDDVDEFLEKLPKFKLAFPHYKNYQVYGAVAGIEIDRGVDRYGYKKGLFVIKPSGDTVAIINKDGFRPEIW
ncbi:MAG: DUF3782 domain-containing protein [Cyanobacteriota bacterium ELA615]